MADDKRTSIERTVDFQLNPEDLTAISEGKSQAVPNVQFFGKTAFTI